MNDQDFQNQVAADMAVRSVVEAAEYLRRARMDNATADYVLAEETQISLAVSSLLITLNDIKQANANRRAA